MIYTYNYVLNLWSPNECTISETNIFIISKLRTSSLVNLHHSEREDVSYIKIVLRYPEMGSLKLGH